MKANQNPTINDLQSQANENKHLTSEQLLEVMQKAMSISARDHALLIFCYSHACRASEVAQLKMQDINWNSMEVTVNRKKGSLRTTQNLFKHKGQPALDEVKALKRWLTERAKTDEPTSFVFSSQKGGAMHPDYVNRIYRKYVDLVNADRLARNAQPISPSASHIHALKHTRCTLLIDAGVSFYSVGLIAGHAALSSTLKYTHGSQVIACRDAQMKADEIFT